MTAPKTTCNVMQATRPVPRVTLPIPSIAARAMPATQPRPAANPIGSRPSSVGSSKRKQPDGTANSTPKPKLLKTNHALPSVAQSPLDAGPASNSADQKPASSSVMSEGAPSGGPSQSQSSQSLIAPSSKVQRQQETVQMADPMPGPALRLAKGAQPSRPAPSDLSAEDGMILDVSQADSTAVSTAVSAPVREPTELDEREHG